MNQTIFLIKRPHIIVKYITSSFEKKKIDWLKNIDLNWEGCNLTINFKKMSPIYVTETYIVIQCLMYQNNMTIKDIFIISKEEKCIVKNRGPLQRIKKMNYDEFVFWMTEEVGKDLFVGSDTFENEIIGLELRFTEGLKGMNLYPSLEGYTEIVNKIIDKY